jgi:hypothetical protein
MDNKKLTINERLAKIHSLSPEKREAMRAARKRKIKEAKNASAGLRTRTP